MTDKLRQKIYRFIDKNGIPGRHFGTLSFAIELQDNLEITHPTKTLFKPDFTIFNLSENEAEQIVIDYVFETTNIQIKSASDLMELKSINNKPFFLILNEHERDKIKYCLAFGKIPGSVILRGTDKIKTLGNIEEVLGDIGFSDSSIEDLGKLKKVNGNIWITQGGKGIFTNLKTLGKLEYVGGDISLKNSSIISLGNLKYVGGNLNLRQTFIEDLGDVEFIGGNLLLPKELKGNIDTSKTKIIGKIKYYNDRSLKDIL